MPLQKRKESVIAIIFSNEKDNLLIIKRRDVPMWVLPGGGIDDGETPQEAVLREVLEETGQAVQILRLAATYIPLNKLARVTYVFECIADPSAADPENLKTGNETKDLKFFSIDNLPSPFFFLHRIWLQEASCNPQRQTIRPLYEVTYLNLLKYFLCHPIRVLRLLLSRLKIPINS